MSDLNLKVDHKLSVLVADDDDDIREFLVELLNEMNLFTSIVAADDGLEATRKAQNQTFDLIITDLSMPKVNGLNFIENFLKANQSLETKPAFIILSGNLTSLEVQKALKIGVRNVLVKPCTEESFLRKVKEALRFQVPHKFNL